MSPITISLPEFQMFLFVFLRVTAILMTAPLFDSRSIPIVFKVGLAGAMSVILTPMLNPAAVQWPTGIFPFGVGVVSEILIGVTIGLSVKMLFMGLQLGGQLAGFQMGFALANVMDPMLSAQIPILAQINNLLAMMIFLITNAHHYFIRAVVDSLRLIPPFGFQFSGALSTRMMELGGQMFVIAVKVGAPIIAAMLLTTVALGIVARTVPQMHIFIVAMPVKIMIGLAFLAITIPYFVAFVTGMFSHLGADITGLLKIM
ncbi:MAG: flagellar biosynthetic protein FliR [Desulfobacterales bacterium]|nr:flagellar biosynthetic protein FliR [Desulfobacterales bacterium]